MAGRHEIRKRIRSVRNIMQVTHALEMVEATKRKRAQALVLAIRPFTRHAWQLLIHLASLSRNHDEPLHPLLHQRPVRHIDLLLLTSSRGLCGALNYSVIQLASEFILEQSVPVRLVTVGRKGRDHMLHWGQEIVAEFAGVSDEWTLREVSAPIANVLLEDYLNGMCDEVYIAYPFFVSTLLQRPTLQKLLPIVPEEGFREGFVPEYIFEPDPKTMLAEVLPRFVKLQVHQTILETMASEHSARMVAMHEATENARELLHDLRLSYNRARQKAITEEVLEVTEGAIASGIGGKPIS